MRRGGRPDAHRALLELERAAGEALGVLDGIVAKTKAQQLEIARVSHGLTRAVRAVRAARTAEAAAGGGAS